MRTRGLLSALGIGATLALAGGCSTGPALPPPPLPQQGPPGVNAPYLMGDIIGGTRARAKKLKAAHIAGLADAAAGAGLAKAESDLRYQTAGTGVDVIRVGSGLLIRLPANTTFDVGRADVKPQFQSTLGEVARTLKSFSQSYVDVLGHTDATGSEPANLALSERRAKSVAAYLTARGVSPARVATKGYGASAPIADNASEDGKAQNRRVEIRVVPYRQSDAR